MNSRRRGLRRFDIGQGPQQLDRGNADADREAAVDEPFAEPVRKARGEAMADELLHDVVGEGEAARDGEMARDEAQEAQDCEEAGPAAIDIGEAAAACGSSRKPRMRLG